MGEVSTIGLDIAKSVFQVHGVDDPAAHPPHQQAGHVTAPDQKVLAKAPSTRDPKRTCLQKASLHLLCLWHMIGPKTHLGEADSFPRSNMTDVNRSSDDATKRTYSR
jgi:hypothetical protein